MRSMSEVVGTARSVAQFLESIKIRRGLRRHVRPRRSTATGTAAVNATPAPSPALSCSPDTNAYRDADAAEHSDPERVTP
jgi:hypothetical protein